MLNNNEKKPLYTSDNPFAISSSISQFEYGYASPGAVIYFPLSSNLLLCSFQQRFEKKNNRQVLKENEVDRANFAQIFSSKRFVFQKSKDFTFIVKTLKDNPSSDENKPKFEVSINDKSE